MIAGLMVALLSFLASFVLIALHTVGQFTVEGWTSIMLSLWFIAGCLAFAVGLSGLYIGRILVEAKGRPTYIIDELIRSPTFATDANDVAVTRTTGPLEVFKHSGVR